MAEDDRMRERVCAAYRAAGERGLVASSSGNASGRLPGRDLMAVTPKGARADLLTPEDVLVVDFEGDPVEGDGIPSTESLMHIAAYRARPDIGGVIHTHSPCASALAVAHRALPPILDEQVLYLGERIEVAEYAISGSEELAAAAVAGLGERNAVLLQHHGLLAVGADIEEALRNAVLVEHVAQVYLLARRLGEVRELPAAAVDTEAKLLRMMRPKGG